MADLEYIVQKNILQSNFKSFIDFYINWLDLGADKEKKLYGNQPDHIVSGHLDFYAALAVSKNDKYFSLFRPEAVYNPLARGEEFGHYMNLVSNPEDKSRLLNSKEGSEEHLKLEYKQEYIARLLALIYLNHQGIKDYNNLWSKYENGMVVLYTNKPESTLAHFLGYTKAEEDFDSMTKEQLKREVKKALYGSDLSKFSDAYNRPNMPQIVPLAA